MDYLVELSTGWARDELEKELRERGLIVKSVREQSPSVYADNRLFVDFRKRIVQYEGTRVALSQAPYSVLELLLKHEGELVTRENLYLHALKVPFIETPTSKPLSVHVRRLRKEIKEGIQTVHGFGYQYIRP